MIIALGAGIASKIALTGLFRWHTNLKLQTVIGVGCCLVLEISLEKRTSRSQQTRMRSSRPSNVTCVKTSTGDLLASGLVQPGQP